VATLWPLRPLTKCFSFEDPTLERLLGPVGGVVPIFEDVESCELDVVADDEDEAAAPELANEFNNARGALGGALPDIQYSFPVIMIRPVER
jgi:hypothetical protein